MLETVINIVHVLTCFFMILVILLQAGKGGGVSAAFGGGAGAALGQRAAATVLGKITAGCAVVFMLSSMGLAIYSSPTTQDPTRDFAEELAAEKAAAEEGQDKAPPAEEGVATDNKATTAEPDKTPVTPPAAPTPAPAVPSPEGEAIVPSAAPAAQPVTGGGEKKAATGGGAQPAPAPAPTPTSAADAPE